VDHEGGEYGGYFESRVNPKYIDIVEGVGGWAVKQHLCDWERT
jgi:hypothetical protein